MRKSFLFNSIKLSLLIIVEKSIIEKSIAGKSSIFKVNKSIIDIRENSLIDIFDGNKDEEKLIE